MNNDWFMDYASHRVRLIALEQEWLEIRYWHLFDEQERRGWITKNGRHILIGEDSGSGKSGKKVDKSGGSGIIEESSDTIVTGGKINDRNYLKALEYEQQAQAFYDACVSNGDSDVVIIANSTGFSYDEVLAIKKHIMEEEHLFEDGSVRKFDANIDQALAWQRLMQNRATETDILLLNHELRELNYMKKTGCTYEKAHKYSSKKFDWQSAVDSVNDTDNIDPDFIK